MPTIESSESTDTWLGTLVKSTKGCWMSLSHKWWPILVLHEIQFMCQAMSSAWLLQMQAPCQEAGGMWALFHALNKHSRKSQYPRTTLSAELKWTTFRRFVVARCSLASLCIWAVECGDESAKSHSLDPVADWSETFNYSHICHKPIV